MRLLRRSVHRFSTFDSTLCASRARKPRCLSKDEGAIILGCRLMSSFGNKFSKCACSAGVSTASLPLILLFALRERESHAAQSMVKHKLARVQQRPENV